jgi:anti-sigma-K factor RskA
MSTNRHDVVSALLGEYALGQLSTQERRDVEEHVRDCSECASELRDLTAVMHGLARAPEAVVPPLGLKQRVLGTLAQEPRAHAPRIAQRSAFASRTWLALAASVIVVLGSALFLTVQRQRQTTDEFRRAQNELSELRARLDDFAGQTDLALSILTAGDMKRIELAGSDAWRGSAARAYWSPSRGLLLVADQLPVPPPGRIYQVWVIGGTTPVSAGLLRSPRTGRGMLVAPPPSGLAPGTVTVAVTDEPPGGLPAPSGSIRLAGSL